MMDGFYVFALFCGSQPNLSGKSRCDIVITRNLSLKCAFYFRCLFVYSIIMIFGNKYLSFFPRPFGPLIMPITFLLVRRCTILVELVANFLGGCYLCSFLHSYFHNILFSQSMEVVSTMSKKLKESTFIFQVDLATSVITYTFARKGTLEEVFLDVGPSSNWGALILEDDKIIYSEYGECIIPFYECIIFDHVPYRN